MAGHSLLGLRGCDLPYRPQAERMHRYCVPLMQRHESGGHRRTPYRTVGERCGMGVVVNQFNHLLVAVISATIISTGNTITRIFQMRYLILTERNLMIITSTKSTLVSQLS